MRHCKHSKLGRTAAHRRSMIANMLKALITNGRIVTTVAKAKHIKGHADRMVTLAKENTLASKRRAISELMITFNPLTSKEARAAKNGDTSAYNIERKVINTLFSELGPRFAVRNGGYTRIIKTASHRIGDLSPKCIIEYLPE